MTGYSDKSLVLNCIDAELTKALEKHPTGFHSAHEGHSVIAEELDELWDHVRGDTAYTKEGLKEAVQTAAMCARFVLDLLYKNQNAYEELLRSYGQHPS